MKFISVGNKPYSRACAGIWRMPRGSNRDKYNISGGNKMKEFKRFLTEEDGMGVVEVILIIVVLISLVALFKTQISAVVSNVLKKVTDNAKKI
jgi:Flp pilus assembly pilin Flp